MIDYRAGRTTECWINGVLLYLHFIFIFVVTMLEIAMLPHSGYLNIIVQFYLDSLIIIIEFSQLIILKN